MFRATAALCITCLVIVSACGSDGESGLGRGESQNGVALPSAAGPFSTDRPGDRLRLYLGYDIPTTKYDAIGRAVEKVRSECSNQYAEILTDAPERSAAEAERADSSKMFRSKFGYGAVEAWRESATRSDSAVVPRLSDEPSLRSMAVEEIAACDEATSLAIGAMLAPPEVHLRANDLVREAMSSSEMSAATKAWQECMSANGFPTTASPLSGQVIVERLLQTASMEKAGGSPNVSESGEASAELQSEGPPVDLTNLGQVEFARLQRIEHEVFRADGTCLFETGAGDAMLKGEDEIIKSLRTEFPAFSGVTSID